MLDDASKKNVVLCLHINMSFLNKSRHVHEYCPPSLCSNSLWSHANFICLGNSLVQAAIIHMSRYPRLLYLFMQSRCLEQTCSQYLPFFYYGVFMQLPNLSEWIYLKNCLVYLQKIAILNMKLSSIFLF